jgi:ethanolaminephosphotransferase
MLKFKYNGQCDSITYKHFWSPLADWLLQFVPPTIAPNTITLSALLVLTFAHVVFVAGVGHGQIAWWRLLLMAVSIMVYQNLDNLDGKQARKTSKGYLS